MPIMRSSQGARGLDAAYYRDADVYAREGERIFQRHWLPIALSDEIRQAGDFVVRTLEDESLLVVRQASGRIQAWYNICRHRGTRLCGESAGHVDGTVRCSYHGWTYELDGTLCAAPHMRDVPDFDPSAWSLVPVTTGVWHGFVWVAFERPDLSLDQWLRPLAARYAPYAMAEWCPPARRQYEVQANWKLLAENYNECYHCPRIHPRLQELSSFRSADNDLERDAIVGGPMRLNENVHSLTRDGHLCGQVFPGLPGDDRRCVFFYSVFPALFVSLHPDYVLVHRLQRISPARTRVTCDLLFHPDVLASPQFDPGSAADFWDMTNRQDWEACERCQEGIASRAYRPGPFSNLESVVAEWDRHYRVVLDGSGRL